MSLLTTTGAAAATTMATAMLMEDRDKLLMPQGGYVAATVVLFFIGFFGFFFNLFVIILMRREKQLWTPLNVILFNLVCSDFSVSILGNPFTFASSIAREWIFGQVMCVTYGFFMSLLGITSITTLTVLSFERYMMISKPFNTHHLTLRTAAYMVVGIWLYSLALTTPPLFGWGAYVHEAANISCSVNWQEQTFNTTTYILFLFFFGLVVPVSVISYSYMNIIRTMKQSTHRIGRVSKVEGRVTYMVAVMVLAFLTAWTPYAVLALFIQFGDPTSVSPAMAVVPALVAKSSICYNPLIYVGLNTQFRPSWQHLLGLPENSTVGKENTMGLTRMQSQMTQDSMDEKRKYHLVQMTESPNFKKAIQPPTRTTILKVSYSDDSYLRKEEDTLVDSSSHRQNKFIENIRKCTPWNGNDKKCVAEV